jgi:hypothetical protein
VLIIFKLFKTIDDKIKDLGFIRIYNNENFVVEYNRQNKQFNYTQEISLIRKTGRTPIIQSYQKDNDKMVGLTTKECNLFLKKIKKMGWL